MELRRNVVVPPASSRLSGAPPPGKAPKTRFTLVICAHLFAALACGSVLFSDLELHPELKGGMVAMIVREFLALLAKVYDYFLPQND